MYVLCSLYQVRVQAMQGAGEGHSKYQGHIVSRVNIMVDSYGIVD